MAVVVRRPLRGREQLSLFFSWFVFFSTIRTCNHRFQKERMWVSLFERLVKIGDINGDALMIWGGNLDSRTV